MHLRVVAPLAGDRTGAVDPLASLAIAAARGDEQAVRTLLASVSPGMLRAARGVIGADHPEVEDVLQEAALGLLRALPSFRSECTVLHFACRVAVLTALAARRRSRARGDDHRESPEEPWLVETRSPIDEAAAARRRAVLRDLCDALPPEQAEALVLHTVLGYTVEEVADAGQAPANTIRSRLRLAKEALRARIAADAAIREALETIP